MSVLMLSSQSEFNSAFIRFASVCLTGRWIGRMGRRRRNDDEYREYWGFGNSADIIPRKKPGEKPKRKSLVWFSPPEKNQLVHSAVNVMKSFAFSYFMLRAAQSQKNGGNFKKNLKLITLKERKNPRKELCKWHALFSVLLFSFRIKLVVQIVC